MEPTKGTLARRNTTIPRRSSLFQATPVKNNPTNIEEDIDELDVFTNFENFLPPDQAVRDTILLELQRTLSLRVQGPVSKEMRRKKKWGETAPQRLAHLHRKYF